MTGLTDPVVGSDGARWPASADECRLDDLRIIVEHPTPVGCPAAADTTGGVPVYDGELLRSAAGSDGDPLKRRELLVELGANLLRGPGIVIVRDAVATDAVARASELFRRIIRRQRETGEGGGDHYARPGANDRVWNALEKQAVADPEGFVDYYRSAVIALVAEAWLGPAYQASSQINVVNPGGEAQRPHRDYHLGFMTEADAARYPAHAHLLSPVLTLQGAVAHGDMSLESGPTKLLPHSQKYGPGFLAWRRQEFVDYFEAHHVQFPLSSGDGVFFNPALFHGAGTNRTSDVERMANLLQISSSMGRAMERIDRRRMCLALYPVLRDRLADGMDRADIDRVIAASAEGYPFPADLDVDQPLSGLTPLSQADRIHAALDEGWSVDRVAEELSGRPAG